MDDSAPISYMVYTSTAVTPFTDDRLFELLNACRIRNERESITGALMYRHGVFVQMLEGPAPSLEALYEKISRDPRHDEIFMVTRGTAEWRIFSEWTMHFFATEDRSEAEHEQAYRRLQGAGDVEDMLAASGRYGAGADRDELHPGLRLLLMLREILMLRQIV